MNDTFAPVRGDFQTLAGSLLGPIEWKDSSKGYCSCPGKHLHTTPGGKRDCRVMLDKVPTVFCVHSHCQAEIDRVNHLLRSEIGKARVRARDFEERRWRPSAEDRRRRREARSRHRLKVQGTQSLEWILRERETAPADYFERSPVRLWDEPADDWRLLLGLFDPSDVVWIGGLYDSGSGHERSFRTVSEWLEAPSAPGLHICPASYKPGAASRSNENVLHRRFLVAESDELSKSDACAIFRWMEQFMKLRAVIDTAGKSVHGWFDFPSEPAERELRQLLPALKFDAGMFKASQPSRLPGALRDGQFQHLLYLDLF